MGFLNNSARHLSGQSDFFPKSVSGKILHNHTRSLMDLIRLCSHIYALTSTNACVSVWFLWHRAHEAVAAEPSSHPQGCSRQAANQSCVFSFGCSHVPCNFLIPFCFFFHPAFVTWLKSQMGRDWHNGHVPVPCSAHPSGACSSAHSHWPWYCSLSARMSLCNATNLEWFCLN